MSHTVALDAFMSAVSSIPTFSSKSEIPNPYSIEDNPEMFLEDSYGFLIGSSINELLEFNRSSDSQDIGVVLARSLRKTDSDPESTKIEIKKLKSDATELRVELLKCTDLEGMSKLTYISTDAFEFQDGYIYTTVNFNYVVIDVINNC